MTEWLISPYFSTLVQQPIERSWFIRVRMDKYELTAFPRYLNMVVRYDAAIPDDDIIASIASNGDDIFRQWIALLTAKDVATHFNRRYAGRSRLCDLGFIGPSSQASRVKGRILLRWHGLVLLYRRSHRILLLWWHDSILLC